MEIENTNNGIRHIGDEGISVPLFNGLKVLVEIDPNGICPKNACTTLTGTIYSAFINIEDRSGLIRVNIDTGQRYYFEGQREATSNQEIKTPFALFVDPSQIVKIYNPPTEVAIIMKQLAEGE